LFFCVIFAGMKHLLWVIVAMMVLGAVVPGCDDVPRYDGRLTAADSLIHDHADSALTMLEALTPSDLATEGDRAYHDLLLTQARYKCYRPATSDSAINRALAYYRAHPNEQEKLTRAYIYKGTVMEELGHPDSAMFYYKQAEQTASPNDYFNLGYVNMRMGAMYRERHAVDGKHIEKYEEALEYFNHTKSLHYQLRCMVNLGSLYCLKYPQKADSMLNIALDLAKSIQDTPMFVGASQNLMKLYLSKNNFKKALEISHGVTNISDNIPLTASFCLYTAVTYAHLMVPDSSQIFMNKLREIPITNAVDTLTLLETKRDIALLCGDNMNYHYYERQAKQLDDSILCEKQSTAILKIEDKIDRFSMEQARFFQKSTNRWLKALIGILVLAIVCIIVEITRRKNSQKQQQQQIQQLEEYIKEAKMQINELKLLQQKLQKHNINDETLKELVSSHLEMIIEIVEECYHTSNQSQLQKIRDIVQFQNANADKWLKLFRYLDIEYDGIISKTKKVYPFLKEKDLLLISMVKLGFSYIQMAMILGYKDSSSISSAKLRLAKKMKLECSINDYVSQFKKL